MRGWLAGAVVFLASAVVASSCTEETPAIDRVEIAGNLSSAQVRQGVGPISIEITGRGLQWVESAFLEDLPVTLRQGTPDGGVTLELVIPHATMPGTRSLTLTLKENRPILTHAGAVEVTTIRATAQGDDTTGRGTPEHPFRTLTHALAFSDIRDEVELGAGSYALVNGERWPMESGATPTYDRPNVPDGVQLKGAGSAVTLLDGTGLLANAAPLLFGGGGSVEGVTLRNFHRGLVAGFGLVNVTDVAVADCTGEGFVVYNNATLRLTGVGVSGCGLGARAINSATLNATNSNFTGNGSGVQFEGTARGTLSVVATTLNTNAGVVVASRGDITLDQLTADQNGQVTVPSNSGIHVSSTPNQLHVRGSTLTRNGCSGIYMQGGSLDLTQTNARQNGLDGISLDGAAQALLDHAGVSQNGRDGVRVAPTFGTTLDISASIISGNTAAGVNVTAGTASIRSSTIDSNGTHAVRVQGSAGLSLPWDPVADPQANQFSVPLATNACLSDERQVSAASAVSVVHAMLQGAIVPSGLVAGPTDGRPRYQIVSSGNQISFLQ